MPTYKDWNEIQAKARALIAQKGEPFSVGQVLRRDVARKLVWVSGFGADPIPMMTFKGDINVYDEWVESDELFVVLTGSGNFIPHVSAKYFILEAIGPGGGGAGSSSVGGGEGGAAGGYARKRIPIPDPGGWPVAGYPYACGTGGTAGATSSPGGDGSGPTTFGSPAVVTANPGNGGDTTNTNVRGRGGTATGGDLNLTGGDGHVGAYAISGGVLMGGGGSGGSTRFGTGGRGGLQGSGFSGHLYGGGGGGGGRTDGGNNSAGAAGANGGILITQRLSVHVVKKKVVTSTPHVPEVGEYAIIAHHFGSRELPKCLGVLQSTGFAAYDAGLE